MSSRAPLQQAALQAMLLPGPNRLPPSHPCQRLWPTLEPPLILQTCWRCCCPALAFCWVQVKALDAEAVEAQPHKGALAAAEELRGLLDGSCQITGKKAGVGSLPAITNAAQVRICR